MGRCGDIREKKNAKRKARLARKALIKGRKRMYGKSVILRTGYTRRGVLPVGINPMHFGRSVLVMMPKLMMMMMVMMIIVVVMVVMMIAVLLSMVPRRVRAMNRVGRIGRSQRQRVHPLFWSRGARVMQHKRSNRCLGSLGDESVCNLYATKCSKKRGIREQ